VQPDQYLDAIRDNATVLVDAAETAGLDAAVPSCPEWAVADLLAHIGRVHRWAAANAARPPDAEFPGWSKEVPTPPAEERPAWVREGASMLVDALSHPPETPAWSWVPPSTIGFWQRRQAHETAMHRVDAQLAAGAPPDPIDAPLAADGIDEWLGLLGAMGLHDRFGGAGETIHFHCTDVDGEWLVRLEKDHIDIEREHGKGDVAARGSASDLICWLQGRAPVERLEVFGEADLLARWREHATF